MGAPRWWGSGAAVGVGAVQQPDVAGAGLGGLVVVVRGVSLDRVLPGERDVVEAGAGRAVVAGAGGRGYALLDAVAPCRFGHLALPVALLVPASMPRRRPPHAPAPRHVHGSLTVFVVCI